MSVNGGPQFTPFSKSQQGKVSPQPKADLAKPNEEAQNTTGKAPERTTAPDNMATLDERHQGPRETVADEHRHPLSWQYFPVPGLHMGHSRELLRPEKGQPTPTQPPVPPTVPKDTGYTPGPVEENQTPAAPVEPEPPAQYELPAPNPADPS